MKRCSRCKVEKDLSEFGRNKSRKDGLQVYCKPCARESYRKHYEANTEKVLEANLKYHEANLEKERESRRKHYAKNPEQKREKSRKWRESNPEKVRESLRKWRESNPEKVRESKRKYYAENTEECREKNRKWREENWEYRLDYKRTRRQSDPNYRLACNLRSRLKCALKGNFKSGSAVRDLGCTIAELWDRLEVQFQPGMTRENYGTVWHVDHILPLSSFDLTIREQLLEAVHYTNLQPLSPADNLQKGAKLDWVKSAPGIY